MNLHEKINYLEFPSKDLEKTKQFFQTIFGWKFTDYGTDYFAFNDNVLDGGFFKSEKCSSTQNGSALVVFYSENLDSTKEKIVSGGGKIVKEIFSFPGGSRFHFIDNTGNEFAVWSDKSL